MFPPSFEWPAGFAPVASTPGGVHIVSLIPASRIQIYDRDWHFVRRWHVDTFADVFRAVPIAEDRVEVVSEHDLHRYVFSLSGNLVLHETYAPVSSPLLKSLRKLRDVFTFGEPYARLTVPLGPHFVYPPRIPRSIGIQNAFERRKSSNKNGVGARFDPALPMRCPRSLV